MNFDPRDLIDSNLSLLHEAAGSHKEKEPFLLMTVATWGRGADPQLLQALQPYRHGLGYNGSVVARVPLTVAREWLEPEVLREVDGATNSPVIYSAVFKDWVVEPLDS